MKTILLVEDDADIRETYAQILADEGYDVEQADSGVVALKVLERLDTAPCLVLLDGMMPEMSGPEMLKVLRDAHRLASLPVVLVSAGAISPEDREGTRRFVKKPATLDVLLAITKEFCGTSPA